MVLNADNKVEVLLAVMHDVRSGILFWTERAYQATVWSVALQLAAAGYWLLEASPSPLGVRWVLASGLFLFGVLAQLHLVAARRSHNDGGLVLVRLPYFPIAPNRWLIPWRRHHAMNASAVNCGPWSVMRWAGQQMARRQARFRKPLMSTADGSFLYFVIPIVRREQ